VSKIPSESDTRANVIMLTEKEGRESEFIAEISALNLSSDDCVQDSLFFLSLHECGPTFAAKFQFLVP